MQTISDKEYIKVILHNGRMVGAILIGETDLEVRHLTHAHHLQEEPNTVYGCARVPMQ